MLRKKKGLSVRWRWWRPLTYIIAILVIPLASFIINAPFFLFLHIMPATICYSVLHPDQRGLLDLCLVLGQYHWVAEIGIIALLVLPCFLVFYGVDCCSYKERRKKNKKHASSCGRFFITVSVTLVLSLIILAPYQIAMMRVCRPGGYGMKFVTPPPDVVEHNSRYYFFHEIENTAMTYAQNMDRCKDASSALGFDPPLGTSAVLAAIESPEEQAFITEYINESHNGIGLLRIGGMKQPPRWQYYWDKGSYGKEDFSYTHWSPEAGKEGWGNCVSLKRRENATGAGDVRYYWVPESCVWHKYLPYLCEMPAQLNYVLCTWITGSIYVAIVLELFTIGFIVFRVVQRRNITEIEFPQDIPSFVITSPDSVEESDEESA